MKVVCVDNIDKDQYYTSKCPLTVGRIYQAQAVPLYNSGVRSGSDVGFLVCDDDGRWSVYKTRLFLPAEG